MADVQKLEASIEDEYIDHLWSRIESLDQTKLFDEAKKINSVKRKLNQTKEKNKTLEKKLKDLNKESTELARLKNLLQQNNDRFFEPGDILDDELFGAWSANEFINFDFLEIFHDPDNKLLVDELSQEVLSVEDWINSLPNDKPKPLRGPPPNRKGQLLKRLKTVSQDDLNIFYIQREQLLDEIKLSFADVFYPNEMIKRYSTHGKSLKIKKPMTYFFDYIKYRIDKSLPWAICGQYLGFVACPAGYRTLLFNTQDGYFNAGYLTGVFSDKTIEDFLRTVEGKMLIRSFPERYTHAGKGIPAAYRLSEDVARLFSDSFVWKGLPGITFETFRGIYIHPELLESFASYLGERTYDWVVPNLKYLRSNPARYINGDSWYIAAAGTVPPNYPIRIKPLQKHLMFWTRENEDPFHVHISFGDKWYLRKVLREPGVRLIVEFFGILDEDYSKVEAYLDEKGLKKKFKTWKFKSWIDVKTAIAEIYLNIDRAYYGYDSLKEYAVKLTKDILFVREKPYTVKDSCDLNPKIVEDIEYSKLSNDRLYGPVSDYIVPEDDDFDPDAIGVRKEFFDDYESKVEYNFKSVKHFPDSKENEEIEYKEVEAEGYFTDIDWKINAISESKTPTKTEKSHAERKESLKSMPSCSRRRTRTPSSTGATASNFGDPLLFRERRKMLLRATVVVYLLKEYTAKENEMKIAMNDPELSSKERLKRYDEYTQKFGDKNHKKEFFENMIKAFYNVEEIELLKRKVPVEEQIINIVELDEEFQAFQENEYQ